MVRLKTALTAIAAAVMLVLIALRARVGGSSGARSSSGRGSLRAGAESDPACENVEAPTPTGDNTCFSSDKLGMACGWDGTPREAYCTHDTAGNLVCARRHGGGKCVGNPAFDAARPGSRNDPSIADGVGGERGKQQREEAPEVAASEQAGVEADAIGPLSSDVVELMDGWPKCDSVPGENMPARRAWCVLDKWQPVSSFADTIAACVGKRWQNKSPKEPCFLNGALDIWSDLRGCCTLMFAGGGDEACQEQGSVDGGPVDERCMQSECWAHIRVEHAKLKAPGGLIPLFDACRIEVNSAGSPTVEQAATCQRLQAEGKRVQVHVRKAGSSLIESSGLKPCVQVFED